MIRPQYLNLANSSFFTYLEHKILEKGGGFNVVTGKYYPGPSINGYYTYYSPVQPLVADESITAPMTGVYVGNDFYKVGQGNLVAINHDNNQLYFSSPANNISGVFPLNDINLLQLDISEEKLLFETQFKLKNQNHNNIVGQTGLKPDEKTFPAIYYSSQGLRNEPLAFGGLDETTIKVDLFLIMKDKNQLDAISSILSDIKLEYFALLTPDRNPFNYLGSFKNTGINFNYNTINNQYLSAGSGLYIKDVNIVNFNRFQNADAAKLNTDVFFGIAEFEICRARLPRNTYNNL